MRALGSRATQENKLRKRIILKIGKGGGRSGEGGRQAGRRNNKTIINTLGERSEKEKVEGRWREGGGTIRQ